MRALLRVDDVVPFETQGGKTLYIIKGHTVEAVPQILRVRTLSALAATLCSRVAKTDQYVWVDYEKAWSASAWPEYNLVKPPVLDDSKFVQEDKAAS